MLEKEFIAKDEQLEEVTDFVSGVLEENDVSPKLVVQIQIVLEELFVNVAHYAYPNGVGKVLVGIGVEDGKIKMHLKDEGIEFNPLLKDDPDITLPAEQRKIGGLGIFMVKKTMDNLRYEYVDKKNCLYLEKKIG